jgi:stage II sporulation protein AA (anti-sigma F factor antagonist)
LSAPDVPFWLDVRVEGGTLVIDVHGELDADTAVELSACAAAAVESTKDDISFDLGQLTFMDSSGTQVFVSIHQALAATGRTLYVDHLSQCARHVLELSRLDQHFARRPRAAPDRTTPAPSSHPTVPPGSVDRGARAFPRAPWSQPTPTTPRRPPTAAASSAPRSLNVAPPTPRANLRPPSVQRADRGARRPITGLGDDRPLTSAVRVSGRPCQRCAPWTWP